MKTVAGTSKSAEYAETRKFYESRGFTPLEIFPERWIPRNPARPRLRLRTTGRGGSCFLSGAYQWPRTGTVYPGARMRVIEANGLTLEPQVAAHADEMFAVLSDPAIYEYENEPPQSMEWLRARFARLESRCSDDGQEAWLNWVIRLPCSELIGYVQATVNSSSRAAIAYVLSSKYWGRGLARESVRAMIIELVVHYQVRALTATLKQENFRSVRLLERLGFSMAASELYERFQVECGELLFLRAVGADTPSVP